MDDGVDVLILDLLAWLEPGPRAYDEVMEAWRTSCPRLPVWEEATSRGLLACRHEVGAGTLVALTDAGRAHLARRRPEARTP